MAALKKKRQPKMFTRNGGPAYRVGKALSSKLWVDFDEEADVFYISLRKPQQATDTVEMDDEGLLLHYRGKELVGVTILDASTR